MAKYSVHFRAGAFFIATVEADSEEEAEELAYEEIPSLCRFCASIDLSDFELDVSDNIEYPAIELVEE